MSVDGLEGAEQAEAVRAELEQMVRRHSLDADVLIEIGAGAAGPVVLASTPYPLIISAFHRWHDEFETDLTGTVAAAAPRATVTIEWGWPDEEA